MTGKIKLSFAEIEKRFNKSILIMFDLRLQWLMLSRQMGTWARAEGSNTDYRCKFEDHQHIGCISSNDSEWGHQGNGYT